MCSRAKIFLQPYQKMHSPQYQKLYSKATKHWLIAHRESQNHIKKLRHWKLFSSKSHDLKQTEVLSLATDIVHKKTVLLWHDYFLRTRGMPNIDEVKECIVKLRNLPSKYLLAIKRLEEIYIPLILDEISRLKLSGIIMTDLKAQVLDTAIRTQEIKSVIEKHRSISFRSLDHVTQQLEKIYCQLNYIEVKISQIDSRRVEVKKQIDESENRLKKYSDLLPYQGNQRLILDPLFIKASSLHSDATTSYIYRQFDTASKWLAISQEISQLGRLVCEMQSVVFYLEKVRSKEQILPKFYTDFDNVVHKFDKTPRLHRNNPRPAPASARSPG